jgi:hypothetical protein
MAGDAEDYDLNPVIRPGQEIDQGFQDASGQFPRVAYIGKSSVNERALGTFHGYKEIGSIRGARVSSDTPQFLARTLEEPIETASPEYPYNSVTETASGHVIEYDDTPGRERINIEHRTGSRLEILADGSIILKSKNKAYLIVASDSDVIVRGTVNIVVESNANMRIKGDMNLQVDGDMNQLVQGNYNLEIQGNENLRIHGYQINRITGSSLYETRGNVIRRNLSNYRERTVGDHTSEIGGSWHVTAEGAVHQMAYGPYNASFCGGLLTLDGADADGNAGEGKIVVTEAYGTTLNFEDLFLENNAHIGAAAYVGDIVHAPEFEGLAKRAVFANTAGTAPTGPAVTTTPNPSEPDGIEDQPTSSESVVDVIDTSDIFILDLDRSPISGFNKRSLNTGEAIARLRNKYLRNNSEFVQDLIDKETITDDITSVPRYTISRSGSASTVSSGSTPIGQRFSNDTFVTPQTSILHVQTIPRNMKATGNISRSTKLSPNFRLSHMLAGDNLNSHLISQAGLSASEILTNMQLLSYNILEPLRNKYYNNWTISEGLYNLLENEKIDPSSITMSMVQGLGVGIKISDRSKYYDIAQWIRTNLVYDKLALSYINYDPHGVNEPTLLVTIKQGTNPKSVFTEYNHTKIEDNILEINE